MQVLKILVVVAFAMPLLGCSQPIKQFAVDGVKGEFCLPSGMVPADIAWIPEDSDSTPRGFTVSGCATRPADSTVQCSRLGQIVSADIASRGNADFFGWKDFKNSASAILFAKDDRTRYQFHGDQLVIKNHHIMDEWLILSTRSAPDSQTDARPKDDDVVVATCFEIGDFPLASSANTGRNYGCYRHMVGPDYSSDYSFVTDSEIPAAEELSKLDSSIISQLEEWRCPAK
jgi:hypothetical protein